MNDPHVVALHYTVEHHPGIDYSRAEPFEDSQDAFDVRVKDGYVQFSMNDHFATERAARNAVDGYIRAWELNAVLGRGPNAFKLRFERCEIKDRNPTPGVKYAQAGPVRFTITTSEPRVTVSPAAYPKPSSSGLKRSPDVESMLHRYIDYRKGREPLTTMAYFCLTVLENSTGERKCRRAAAMRYRISPSVLKTLARLSTTKGGTEARKAEGVQQELSQHERQFLEAAVAAIIRRVAEVAHDPDAPFSKITMHDLPPLAEC